MRHHLFNIDGPNRMADCEACGCRVDIISPNDWRCGPRNRANLARYNAVPEHKAAMREYGAQHYAIPEYRAAILEHQAQRNAIPEVRAVIRERASQHYAIPEVREAVLEQHAQYHDTPEGKATQHRAGQKRNGHLVPEFNLRERETLLGMQKNRCPICLRELDAYVEWPNAKFAERDHAHDDEPNPGEFRGYLDGPCNKGLKRIAAQDTPKGKRARAYLALADKHVRHDKMLNVHNAHLKEQEVA